MLHPNIDYLLFLFELFPCYCMWSFQASQTSRMPLWWMKRTIHLRLSSSVKIHGRWSSNIWLFCFIITQNHLVSAKANGTSKRNENAERKECTGCSAIFAKVHLKWQISNQQKWISLFAWKWIHRNSWSNGLQQRTIKEVSGKRYKVEM